MTEPVRIGGGASDRAPKPPKHLKTTGRRLWRQIAAAYELEDHHLVLLDAACVCVDRLTAAGAALSEHGLVYTDVKGGIHPRPEIAVERDNKVLLARMLRELNLDASVADEYSRMPRIAGRYEGRG